MWKHKAMTQVWDAKRAEYIKVAIDIEVDWSTLAHHLATKAYGNRSAKSKIQGGMITATVNETKFTKAKR